MSSGVWMVAGWYVVTSATSFVAFGWDKLRARAASGGYQGRVPERRLHTLSWLGGWPGSVAAMVLFRHKTRKPVFVAITAGAAIAHLAAWVGWLLVWGWPGRS